MNLSVKEKADSECDGVRSRLVSLAASLCSRLICPETTYMVWEKLFWLMGRRPRGQSSPASVKSILVVRNDGIGDVILTSPLLKGLRSTFPAARVTLVVRPAVRNLVELCPYVDEILVYNRAPKDKC